MDARYPIGRFAPPSSSGPEARAAAIEVIRNFSAQVQELLREVSTEDLRRTYRPGSWNVAQLVHHCADANMNCFIRFKLALSEEIPTVKPYLENDWATRRDYSEELVDASIQILQGVNARWCHLMETMSDAEWERKFYHPEQEKTIPLKEVLFYYSWHCSHHYRHLEIALL